MKLAKQDLGKVSITVEKEYWNSNKSYDRLVIVEVLGVGCYLSRKAVPSGIQYDNREYWIKFGKTSETPSPEPTEFPIVTEFGDSVDVTIAQKTITDKFSEVDNTASGLQTSLEIGFENVDHRLERVEAGDIPEITNRLSTLNSSVTSLNNNITSLEDEDDRLDEQITITNENLSLLQDDINDHLSKIRRIREDLNSNVETTEFIRGRVNELTESAASLSNDLALVGKSVWQSNVRTKPVLYIGDRLTEQVDDSLLMSKLEDELGIRTAGTIIKENFLDTTRLRYIIDNPEDFGDGLDLWLNEIIIIQLGVNAETIGTYDPTSPAYSSDTPVDPADYGNTFVENILYFLDKLHQGAREENTKPTVFIIAPPRPAMYADIKTALTSMSEVLDFVLINPFTDKYDLPILKNITINSDTKTVISYDYVEYWANYISRMIKTNC